jgi:molybdopterin-guanine dinucleotide biosynthesis protein A
VEVASSGGETSDVFASRAPVGTVAGAVLTGGAGRRIGGSKPLVEFGGVALASLVTDALRSAGCTPVVAVGGDADELAALQLEVIPDLWPGEGPLGGLVTACRSLFATPVDAVVVAACDLPRLDGPTVRRLIDATPSADVVVARGERRHAGLMRCSPAAAEQAERWFLAGERRLSRLVEDNDVRVVDCPVDEYVMTNVNEPGDLEP